jgi:hypothetical protein
MRSHSGIFHPGQDEISRDAMFRRKENPRQMLACLGNRPELIDPAYDFIAKP